ncbi:hypothetical protein K6V71_00615 [Cupriavidus gilardii]
MLRAVANIRNDACRGLPRDAPLRGAQGWQPGLYQVGRHDDNAPDKVAYIAMSRTESSRLNGSGGVKVESPYSGGVYAQNLRGGGQADSTGAPINSVWMPVDMVSVMQ